jgi:hypothetical protein
MAIARLSVKVGKSGKASPHASYIAREGEYAKYTERGEKLEHKEHGNMPNWAQHDPQVFWKAADQYERKNGTTYREFEIALPRELTAEQRQGLVGDFVKQEIGNKYPYQFAIHNPKSLDGDEQPHVHLMFSERRLDGIDRDPDQHFKRYNAKHPERGGAQKDNTGKTAAVRKEELIALRSRWETMCNEHLEKHGHQDRIDMRSYKDQGLELEPTNLKISDWKNKEKRETALKTRAINKEVIASKRELEKTIPNLGRELKGFQKNRIAAIREQGAALRKDRPLTQAEIDRRAKFEARMAKINQPKENQKMTDNNQQQQDKFEPSGLTHEERLAQQDKDQKAQEQRDNIHKPDDKEQARRQANIEAGIAAGQRANERMDSERAKPQAIAQDFSKDSMAAQEWRGGIGTKSAEDKKIESEILNKQVELEIKMREQGRPVDSLQQVKDIEAKAKAEQQTEKQAEKVQPVEQENEQDSKQNDRLESERANVLERAHEERQNEQQPATQEASERTAPKQMSIQEMREQGRALRAEREAQKANTRDQGQER